MSQNAGGPGPSGMPSAYGAPQQPVSAPTSDPPTSSTGSNSAPESHLVPGPARLLALGAGGLAMVVYLLGFVGDFAIMNGLAGPLIVSGGLLAAAAVLPKAGRALLPGAVVAVTGFLSLTQLVKFTGLTAVVAAALLIAFLAAAAAVGALLIHKGLVKAPAPRPSGPSGHQQQGYGGYPPGYGPQGGQQGGFGQYGAPQGQGGGYGPPAYPGQQGQPGYGQPPSYGAPQGYPGQQGYSGPPPVYGQQAPIQAGWGQQAPGQPEAGSRQAGTPAWYGADTPAGGEELSGPPLPAGATARDADATSVFRTGDGGAHARPGEGRDENVDGDQDDRDQDRTRFFPPSDPPR